MPKWKANPVEKVIKKMVNRQQQKRKRRLMTQKRDLKIPPECAWRNTLNQIPGISSPPFPPTTSRRGRRYRHSTNQNTHFGDWSTNVGVSQESMYIETAGQSLSEHQLHQCKMPTPKANQVKGVNKKNVKRQRQEQLKNKKIKAIQEAAKSLNVAHIQPEHKSGATTTAVAGVWSPNVKKHGKLSRKSKEIAQNALTKGVAKNIAIALSKCDTPRPKDFDMMPIELQEDVSVWKYWKKRYYLFSRFDEGIKLDNESWYSVTPEPIARKIAERRQYDLILDAFCGAGGNTIQFAKTCGKRVLAIDIDPNKVEMARHNSRIYGVEDRIEFFIGDFFAIAKLAPFLKADMVFLSPPWGGPDYVKDKPFDIETLEPRPASELVIEARKISTSVTLYLPRNSRRDQIQSLAGENDIVEIKNMMGGSKGQGRSLQAIVVYYVFCDDPVPPQSTEKPDFAQHFDSALE